MKRKLRQAPAKTQGSNDEPDAVMSLLARSSFPKSMIRNRNHRSSSKPALSSNKNITTVKVRPTPVSSRPTKVSIGKNLINTFLTALSSPYLSIY